MICAKTGRVSGKYVTRKSGIAVFCHYTMTRFKLSAGTMALLDGAREPFNIGSFIGAGNRRIIGTQVADKRSLLGSPQEQPDCFWIGLFAGAN